MAPFAKAPQAKFFYNFHYLEASSETLCRSAAAGMRYSARAEPKPATHRAAVEPEAPDRGAGQGPGDGREGGLEFAPLRCGDVAREAVPAAWRPCRGAARKANGEREQLITGKIYIFRGG